MPLYQIFTDVSENNVEEFVRSLRTLRTEFLEDKGCLSFHAYRDFEDDRSFVLIGVFASHESMQKHFKTRQFEVLIGATQVLSRSFELVVAEAQKKGGYDLFCQAPALHTDKC